MDGPTNTLEPRCVASTAPMLANETPIFKSSTWSADGTCVVTNSDDNAMRTYVLPPDLLADGPLIALEPFCTIPNQEPVYSTALYPHYNLSDQTTTCVLSSLRDHPIRLSNTLHSALHASYPLVNPNTEEYIAPHSLLFTHDGAHFIAGSDSLLTVFDMSRSGQGPVERHATIPSKRKTLVGGGVGIKGILSALSCNSDGLLAVGTFTRCIGLYSNQGRGERISVFSLAGEEGNSGGSGVTQTLWSPCGRYLYVAERKSDGLIVYDVRVAGKKLGILTGRKAVTNQRMAVDIVSAGEGHELWAGGTDGVVRVWQNPHLVDEAMEPSESWEAHSDAVSSVQVHPTGSVIATCSGQRHITDSIDTLSDSEDESGPLKESNDAPIRDFSMKIWSL